MRDRVDVVAGRALVFGLVPGTSSSRAARELLRLADGEGSLLRRAIERVEDGLHTPQGRAGPQVVGILAAALEIVEPRRALSCASR